MVTLPPQLEYPEGVAYDPAAKAFYTAGAEDGAIVRVGADGAAQVVAAPGILLPAGNKVFPAALGMTFNDGRLFIAGGITGKMWVVDAESGNILKTYVTPTGSSSLLNDVAIADGHAYFTDSYQPVLWRAAAGATLGALEPWLDLKSTPVKYADGVNINGIAATADGTTLFIVQMNKGLLFKVDIASKQITAIDLNGRTVRGADGLVLDGGAMYVVRQPAAEIVTIALNEDMTAGEVKARFTDSALRAPATAVKVEDRLYVVNSQFNKREGAAAVKPFTFATVPLSLLQPR